MPSAITTAELGLIVPSMCGMDAARAQILIDGAQAAAEKYCNRSFATSVAATEYYDWPAPGTRPEIILNRRPVTAVSDVRIDPQGGAGQLTGTFGTTTALTAGTDYCFDGTAGTLTLLQTRSNWPLSLVGYGNIGQPFAYATNRRNQVPNTIMVTYTAGYTTVPTDVKLAIAQIASVLGGSGGLLEAGGRAVTSYIDVSVSTGVALDALAYGNSPALGSARSILGSYRDPAFSRGRW